MAKLKSFTFAVEAGFSSPAKNQDPITSLDFPHTSHCSVRVNFPVGKLMCFDYPLLVKRLVQDWGDQLSTLGCSTGDFGVALREGRVSLGHVWAEMYCLCLDYVIASLDYEHVRFKEQYRRKKGKKFKRHPGQAHYMVRLRFSEPLPPEFSGLEHLINGYLNAAFHDQPFDIRKRLKEFVDYRREEQEAGGKPKRRLWRMFLPHIFNLNL